MASVSITVRTTRSGVRRFVVRYRLGGRAYPVQHAGSFATHREARTRRDLIAGELAAGRNPADLLRTLATEPAPLVTVAVWCDRFLASRIDVDANTTKNYRVSLAKACDMFGSDDPATITPAAVAGWVARLAAKYKPGTVRQDKVALALLLDFAGVEPNPARDPRVKLPKRVAEEPNPPTAEHLLAILDAIPNLIRRLALITIEQGALREGEAVSLRWGDVDRAGLRLRLPRSATKRDKARWVYLPEWLMDAIERLSPLEDRAPERRVFQGLTEARLYQTMVRACQTAGVPHYHPHDLRHRRITIWHQSGVVARELAERAGHSRPSMSLDVYSHVMPQFELLEETLRELVRA
jgi:integrase